MFKKFHALLFIAFLLGTTVVFTSCGKEKQPTDNGLFTITPIDDDTDPNQPGDPEPIGNTMSWSMRIDNALTQIDTALVYYSFENNFHVFKCNPGGNDVFKISLQSLDSALYTVDLEHTLIEYVQNGITYNGANSPQGVVHLVKNQNNKISVNYSARLFNLSSGQERIISDGKMRNIPYE